MKLIFASQNEGKLIEMRQIVADFDIEVLSAKEAGVIEDVVEDKETFEDNSEKKARFVSEQTGEWAIADDSGICIEALGCRPGVYTARWAGEGASGDDLVRHTLEQMKDIPEGKRQAYFETAAVLISPTGEKYVFTGRVQGRLALAPQGIPRPKLPYDLIFIPEGHDRTFAEMSDDEKNALSHRGEAFRKFKVFLEKEKDRL